MGQSPEVDAEEEEEEENADEMAPSVIAVAAIVWGLLSLLLLLPLCC